MLARLSWARRLVTPKWKGSMLTASTTQHGELVARVVGTDVIDLSVGQPSPDFLPLPLIQQAAQDRLSCDNSDEARLLLQYGPLRGYRSFRQAVATFLNQRHPGYSCSADSLLVTAGVSHGLDLVVRHLTRPGQVVVVECPTYFLAKRVFEQAHTRQLLVPTDDQGMDVSCLKKHLQEASPEDRPVLVYTIPMHHNPGGMCLAPHRAAHLIELAHEYQFYIAADEVYTALTFPDASCTPVPMRAQEAAWLAAKGVSTESRVISLSSFSKILAPGLRLGWVEADHAILQVLLQDGALGSGGCVASLAAGVVHSAIQLGLLDQHLDQVVLPSLSQRCKALCAAVRTYLPQAHFIEPQGGYFVWVQLPVEAEKLLAHAGADHGVRFTPGPACGMGMSNWVRLCFAFYTPEELTEGVLRLSKALQSFTGEGMALRST